MSMGTESSDQSIEMFVGGLVLDPSTQAPVVLLKDEGGTVCLPIWIGVAEATSIASSLKQIAIERPLSHDLMYAALVELGARIERVLVTDLRDATYFAEIILTVGERVVVLDARPSDAIALALRCSAPIYVAVAVLDRAKVKVTVVSESMSPPAEEGQEGKANFSEVAPEKWSEILDGLDPDDFKYKQ